MGEREGGARRRGVKRGWGLGGEGEGRGQEGERSGRARRGRGGARRGGEGPRRTVSTKGPEGQGLNPSNDPSLGNWLEFVGPSYLTRTEGPGTRGSPHNLGPALEAARGAAKQ